ncbi:hypothetical protein [Xanthomonas arboricola]|uniref:hypothetical protein n=1 Tax=Xanthomonas arboricola TaxID=56448 RepID=UPI0011B05EF9|nr:hypothetical protein [Xanthomonas arboricola]
MTVPKVAGVVIRWLNQPSAGPVADCERDRTLQAKNAEAGYEKTPKDPGSSASLGIEIVATARTQLPSGMRPARKELRRQTMHPPGLAAAAA